EYYRYAAAGKNPGAFILTALAIEILLGYLTTTASIMAFGKLQEIIPTRPMTYKGQNFVNLVLLAIAIGIGGWMITDTAPVWAFPVYIFLSLLFGVLLIVPIGGGDMPTVI